MQRVSVIFALLITTLLALASIPTALAQSPVPSPLASPIATTHGIDIVDMDLSADPAQDFWQFANGGWLERTEIPADEPAFGVTNEMYLRTVEQQLAQLNALMQSNTLEEGSDQWKAVRFFEQGIDMDTRNAQGIAPVQPQLDLIASATDLAHLHELMASKAFASIPEFFNVGVIPDPADSTINTAWMVGPLLGLPDVTYYTEDSESNLAVGEAYKTAAASLFQLVGMSESEAIAAAQAVYDFEATMAADLLTDIEMQDFSAMYNPTTVDEMQALYPALDWHAYMTARGAPVDGSSIIIDSELRLMQNLAAILANTDFQTIKDFLTLQVMMAASPYLDQQTQDISFAFLQVLLGVQEQQPLERDVLASVNGLMPDALGQLYVADYFSPEAKAAVEQLVDNLIAAFRVRLENNTWMSAETKIAAIEKLDAMRVKVGYPDKWRSYEHYPLGDSYWATVRDSMVAESQYRMNTYGEPVDKDEWGMPPQMVNAQYNPLMNDITFPAAILQTPFFDPEADLATNYGETGYTIGHEITHAFDLQGSQFDKDGNFADWWTEADLAAFDALNEKAVIQYGKIEVLPGLFIDGQLTVTENVADMGGLQVAWDALQIALAQEGDPGEIDGFTQAQRFFIAAAQSWQAEIRDETMRLILQSDAHAPDSVRGVVPAMNMDAFYDAFPEIQPGDPMHLPPDERIVIW